MGVEKKERRMSESPQIRQVNPLLLTGVFCVCLAAYTFILGLCLLILLSRIRMAER